jgi:hypothetical protein
MLNRPDAEEKNPMVKEREWKNQGTSSNRWTAVKRCYLL